MVDSLLYNPSGFSGASDGGDSSSGEEPLNQPPLFSINQSGAGGLEQRPEGQRQYNQEFEDEDADSADFDIVL